jgi:hypothetical protein
LNSKLRACYFFVRISFSSFIASATFIVALRWEAVFIQKEDLPMKKAIAAIVLLGFSVAVYAEPVAKGVNDDVVDIECMPGSAVCDVTLTDGRVMSEEQGMLDRYLPVANDKGASETPLFVYNANGEIIGLNPKTFNQTQPEQQQQPSQQSSEPPYQVATATEVEGTDVHPIVYNVMRIISKVNGLQVYKVTVNEGSNKCFHFDASTSRDGKKRSNLNMGDALTIPLLKNCNFIKMDVETNMGAWTHGQR